MTLLTNLALALMFGSGIYFVLSDSWTALYKANVFFHPLYSLAATIGLLVYYVGHSVDKVGAGPMGVRRGAPAVKFAGAMLAASVAAAAFPAAFLPLFGLGTLVAFQFASRKMAASKFERPWLKTAALFWQAEFFLLILCLFSGTALFPTQGAARPAAYVQIHKTLSYAATGGFAFCLLLPLAVRPKLGFDHVKAYLAAMAPALAPMAVVGILLAGAVSAERGLSNPTYRASLSTIPLEERPAEDRMPPPLPVDAAEMLLATESCASNTGCHQEMLEDFKLSNHWLSNRTVYFEKNVGLMASEIGEENLPICSGCHYPYMMFSGNLDRGHPLNAKGFSCAYCHQASSVEFSETDHRVTYLTIEAKTRHLRSFLRPADDPAVGRLDALAVKLNPTGHGRVFSNPLYEREEFCLACHVLQVKPARSMGLERNSCAQCHMQARSHLGLPGERQNHFFPGSNATVPFTLDLPGAAAITARWANGAIYIDDSTVRFWDLRKQVGDLSGKALWLFVNLEAKTSPVPGEPFEANVITTNVGINHQFPAAPLDLVEAWLFVEAKDADGKTLFSLGELDETHRLPADYPEEHRLGGRAVDAEGRPIDRYRVWRNAREIPTRTIESGATTVDRIRFLMPKDAVGPVILRAEWKYRKHNQDFMEWGMGDAWKNGGRIVAAPVTTVGEVEKILNLAGGR